MKLWCKAATIVRAVYDDKARFIVRDKLGLNDRLSDEEYVKRQYYASFGKHLNLQNPKTFNEKIQWLKLHDRKEIYTKIVDKILVKDLVEKIIGRKYIIPTIGMWDNPMEIDFSELPDTFVLKCNHNSGGIHICKNKESLDVSSLIKKFNHYLSQDYYKFGREWPYKNVVRKVFAEEYLNDGINNDLNDYKVFTFNGKARYIQVDYDRFSNHHRNFYDTDWNYMPFTTLYPTNPDKTIERPKQLGELINLAETLASAMDNPPFLRVDMFIVKENLLFGELTLYHGSGTEQFMPVNWAYKLGNMINLPTAR